MTTKQKILTIVLSVLLISIWIIGRLTGAIGFYTVPTASMSPAINPDDLILGSTLLKPANQDIICFVTPENQQDAGALSVKRMIAKEGDVLEVRQGIAYVNGKLADDTMQLRFMFLIPDYMKVPKEMLTSLKKNGNEIRPMDRDISIGWLTYAEAEEIRKEQGKCERFSPQGSSLEANLPGKKPEWTTTNFGPFKIPDGTFFVMGDSRDNSLDSRYIGLIPMANCRGKVFKLF